MHTIGFIGLGLIGGSLARAIRKARPDDTLIAYSPRPEETVRALADGVIDRVCGQEDAAFSECDMIFLCAPVQNNLTYLPWLRENTRKDCILTDTGSVKGIMADAAAENGLSERFIGGHPMAGTERSGYENSSEYLFENAWYFITPSDSCDPEQVAAYRELIESIRALPLILRPEEHDRIVAGVSHLPHIIASSLVNTIRTHDTDEEYMKQVAAGGFRDITRIASSSPDMWEQICMTNRSAILSAVDQFISVLQNTRSCIENRDGASLRELLSCSKDYRDSLNDTSRGSMPRRFALHVDLCDEAGGIATVTTLLAMSDINIRNIGILHNREFEEGVLRIEFYDEASRDQSEKILTNRNYTVRKRS